jgi:hypothetical protein
MAHFSATGKTSRKSLYHDQFEPSHLAHFYRTSTGLLLSLRHTAHGLTGQLSTVEMHCRVCRACFQSFWEFPDSQEHVHHHDYSSLYHSSAQGCRLCMDIMERIPNTSEPQSGLRTVWEWQPSRRNDQLDFVYINMLNSSPPDFQAEKIRFVYASAPITDKCPMMPACDGVDEEGIPEGNHCNSVTEYTGSQQTWSHVLRWLKNCSDLHGADCNSMTATNWVPSRLLQVDNDGRVRLRTEFCGISVRYLTLSHCWGIANTSQPKLTSKNIESLKRDIDLKSLSKTFKDAIEMTRRLKVDFLWIDSLCIIQGDEQDWQREASRMGQVYGSSMLNISAHSDESGQGCFRIRDPSRVQLIPLDSRGPQYPHKLRAMYSNDFWYKNVDCSPVNDRGWV